MRGGLTCSTLDCRIISAWVRKARPGTTDCNHHSRYRCKWHTGVYIALCPGNDCLSIGFCKRTAPDFPDWWLFHPLRKDFLCYDVILRTNDIVLRKSCLMINPEYKYQILQWPLNVLLRFTPIYTNCFLFNTWIMDMQHVTLKTL